MSFSIKQRTSKLVLLTVAVLFSTMSFAAGSPVGKWQTIDDKTKKPKSIIEITSVNNVLEGKILELLNTDDKNPLCKKCKGDRANQPIVGMTILWDVTEADNKKSWGGGEILDPKKGKTYSVKLTSQKGGDELKVRGFIGTPFIGRTQIWKKVK